MAIINSILNTDIYKLTMQAAVLELFPDAVVEYRFKNRELWKFTPVREFKRTVAKTYPDQWTKYIVMQKKLRVADLYKKEFAIDKAREDMATALSKYNEFEI